MSTSTVALTIEMPSLDASLSWNALESLVVGMSHEVPARALALALDDAQERLLQEACGPRWAPVRGLLAPFACPGCGAREDFARKGKRTRPRKLHTAAGTVELILWHVGCRGCGRNFAPLLVILGLSGKRRTDRLSLDLAELGTQMSFARAGRVDAELAGTSATAGQAHNAMADVAALLTGGHEPEPDDDQPVADEPHEPDEPDADRPEDDQPAVADADAADEPGDGQPGGDQPGGDQPGGDQPGAAAAGGGGSVAGQSFTAKSGAGERLECRVVGVPVLGPGHLSPKVVMLDGTGGRAGDKTNGVPVNLAIGLTGRSGPVGRRRAHTHLLGLTVGEDWSMMGAQLQEVAAPALVVVDGEAAITVLAQRLWPAAPIQRCWWHLPHGLRKAFYADDAANRHVNPPWARTMAGELAELLREQIRGGPQALGQDGDGGLAVDHDQGGRGHLPQLGAHHRPVLADGQAEQVGVGASATDRTRAAGQPDRQVHGNPVGLVSGPAPGAVEHDDLRGQVPRPEHRHSHDPALEPFTRTGLGRERLARNGSAPARRCRTGLVTTW